MLVNDKNEANQAENHILHPGSRALFRFWEGIRAERAAPARDDLDLQQIRTLVPNLFMLERDHIRQTFKWRLAGTRTCELFRQELTGKDALAGWDKFESATIKRLFDGVVTSLQPCLVRFRLNTTLGQMIGAELIGLPLQARKDVRIHVFGGIFPFRDIDNLGYDGISSLELSGARAIWTEHLPGDRLVEGLRGPGNAPFKIIQGGRS
ncbi:MAG: PAS domain-containing protein [Aestuariivirga sp.]